VNITHFEVIVGILAGIAAVLVPIAAGIRWIYRQGQANAEQISATRLNTKATQNLADAFGLFSGKTEGTIADHERRITRVETHLDIDQDRRRRGTQ
jgi:hypothetical protein